MKTFLAHRFTLVVATMIALFLSGCNATQVALTKNELIVNTKVTTSIFVDPVARDKRTIYLDVRSSVMEFDRRAFKNFISEQFFQNDNGYRIVDDPDQAQFTMLVYVVNFDKASTAAAEAAYNRGYVGDAVITGALIGSAISDNHSRGAVNVGLAVGAAELISGALVKDVTYLLVADIQIKEQTKNGAIVRTDTQTKIKVSDNGNSVQSSSEVSTQKTYQTRIVTTANKANLKLDDARDLMFKKTAYAMSGFF